MKIEDLNLSVRQKLVLQCVVDAANEGKRPYTKGVVNRMLLKGYEITERQCAYDLGVIINTHGSHTFSVRYGSKPTLWIYEAPATQEMS